MAVGLRRIYWIQSSLLEVAAGDMLCDSPSGSHFRGLFSGGSVAVCVCVVCKCVHIMCMCKFMIEHGHVSLHTYCFVHLVRQCNYSNCRVHK